MGEPVAYAKVKINGADVSATVAEIDVEDHDRLIDRARVVIDDPHQAYAHVLLENQKITIDLGWADEHAVMFEGVVSKATVTSVGGASQRVFVTAFDPSYLLNQGESRVPRLHKGKLSAIVKGIVTGSPDHGITVGQIAIDDEPSYPDEAPLVQAAGTSRWGFVQALAIEHGCRAFVEYNEGKCKFYFVSERRLLDGKPQGELQHGTGFHSLIHFRYQRMAGAAVPVGSAATMDFKTGEVVATPPGAAPSSAPVAASAETRSQLKKVGGGLADVYDQAVENASKAERRPEDQVPREVLAGLPADPKLAERLVRRDKTRLLGLFGEGVAMGSIGMRAKGTVTINGIAPWAEGTWYVARVNHVYSRAVQGKQDRSTYRTCFAVTR